MEVLQESRMMIPDCHRRLAMAHADLQQLLVSMYKNFPLFDDQLSQPCDFSKSDRMVYVEYIFGVCVMYWSYNIWIVTRLVRFLDLFEIKTLNLYYTSIVGGHL